jgi:hypothetical protein
VISYSIKGGREIDALLQKLPVEIETKILRNGLAAGARVIRDEARVRVNKKSGLTEKAIVTSRSLSRDGTVIAKVKMKGRHSFLGRFLEYGVLAHQIWVRSGKGSLAINGVPIGKRVSHPGFAP